MKTYAQFVLVLISLGAVFTLVAKESASLAQGAAAKVQSESAAEELVNRGQYLVKLGGCADCHTPKMMSPQGPLDDPARRFAGHPSDLILPPPSLDPKNPWGAATAGMTAWTGPWGISYASNLTPDVDTGIGGWSEEEFIKTLRTGKHRGTGRAVLPPMPWQPFADAKEDDLRAIHAYLKSLPPVYNLVPSPLPPVSAAR
jgi:mono/diheme cytochrome c family protein